MREEMYQQNVSQIRIETDLPPMVEALVNEWASIHLDDLLSSREVQVIVGPARFEVCSPAGESRRRRQVGSATPR